MQAKLPRLQRDRAGAGEIRVLLLCSLLAQLALLGAAWLALQPPTPRWLRGEIKAYSVADYGVEESGTVFMPLSAEIVEAVKADNASFQTDKRSDLVAQPHSLTWLDAGHTPTLELYPRQTVPAA
ncbi:MAG TPA: hypothetical protein VF826_05730, partial [Chloroflexia bacterium]